MQGLRFLFLLSIIFLATGYRFRCWWMCQDQTAIQNGYVEERDRCRQYAQVKLDMAMRNSGEEDTATARKAKLVSLFSECMAENGWNTTDIKPPGATPGGGGGPPPPKNPTQGATTEAAIDAAEERAALSRASECAFARQSASASSIAAARAKACDLECDQRLKAAPDAPRPAACPAVATPGMETGVERTY